MDTNPPVRKLMTRSERGDLSERGGGHVTGSMDLRLCYETDKSSFIGTVKWNLGTSVKHHQKHG